MYRKTWWLNPIVLYSILLILVIYSYDMSETQYDILYLTEKALSIDFLFLHLFCFILFFVGYILSKRMRVGKTKFINYTFSKETLNIDRLYNIYKILYKICILAYVIWYLNFLRINGLVILNSFRSLSSLSAAMYQMRNNSGRIGGVTSFSEIGMVVIPIGVFLWKYSDKQAIKKKCIFDCLIILALATFRAFAFSERLALIELLVPALVMYISICDNRKLKKIIFLGPIIGVLSLVIVFGVFEYSRSWLRHYYLYYDSYFEFIIQRILGYYCNAINTECLYLKYSPGLVLPYYSVEWLWKMPGLMNFYLEITPFDFNSVNVDILYNHGNPEFNNPGGMLTLVKDFGIFFPLFQLIFGYVIGRVYRLFTRGNVLGLILYSYVYVVLLELPRYFLLGSTRSLAVYVGVLILMLQFKKK